MMQSQSQTSDLENVNNATAQLNQTEPVVEYQAYDISVRDPSATTCYLPTDAPVADAGVVTPSTPANRKTPARHRFKWSDSEINL